MILGVNLAMNRPRLATLEARELMAHLGRSVTAIEIGNEPDLYRRFTTYRLPYGTRAHVRDKSYDPARFSTEFRQTGSLLPGVPLAGPAFANRQWMAGLSRFLKVQRRLAVVTFHRYPMDCFARPGQPSYASIANLLSDTSSRGLADGVEHYVSIAHAQHLPFRLDELNSVSCGGKQGVSDTFASGLWLLDTLFEMVRVGVDGVNVHTLPHAAYEPFAFTLTDGFWQAAIHPSYYGMLMFTQAAPPGSRLVSTINRVGSELKVWSTIGRDGRVRYVLINKGARQERMSLRISGSSSTATVERLIAPGPTATSGVTLGGQSFEEPTSTGALAGPSSVSTIPRTGSGGFVVSLPAYSATLVTS